MSPSPTGTEFQTLASLGGDPAGGHDLELALEQPRHPVPPALGLLEGTSSPR